MTWTLSIYLTTDFTNGKYNPYNFKNEIIASSINNAKTIIDTGTVGTQINLVFDLELDAGELIVLDELVTLHDSSLIEEYLKTETFRSIDNKIISSSYRNDIKFIYPGSKYIDPIKKIKAIGYMDDSVTNFSIIIYDKTNNQIIATNTFTNTTPDSILDLGVISNIPTEESLIQIKYSYISLDKKKFAYVSEVIFYY